MQDRANAAAVRDLEGYAISLVLRVGGTDGPPRGNVARRVASGQKAAVERPLRIQTPQQAFLVRFGEVSAEAIKSGRAADIGLRVRKHIIAAYRACRAYGNVVMHCGSKCIATSGTHEQQRQQKPRVLPKPIHGLSPPMLDQEFRPCHRMVLVHASRCWGRAELTLSRHGCIFGCSDPIRMRFR